MPNMKPILKPGAVYFADNGAAICLKCAGASAKYTGRDISGQAVERVSVDDAAYLASRGIDPKCESGCTTISPIAGADGWPMVAS